MVDLGVVVRIVDREDAQINKSLFSNVVVVLLLLIGLSVNLNPYGRFTLLDLVALIMIPVTFIDSWKNPRLKRILLALLSLQIIQNISDLINGTKSLSVPGLFGIQVIGLVTLLYWLWRRGISLFSICLGVASGIVSMQYFAGEMNSLNFWKYNIAFAATVTILTSCFCVKNPRNSFKILALVSILIINVLNDFRAGIFGSLIFIIVFLWVRVSGRSVQSSKGTYLRFRGPMILGALILGCFVLYPSIANSGLLGERSKSEMQDLKSLGRGYLYVFEVRKEIPYLVSLAWQSPIVGYGSYGRPTSGQVDTALSNIDGIVRVGNINVRNWITTGNTQTQGYYVHSRLGAFLVFGGFLSLFFWLNLFRLFIQGTFMAMKKRHSISPFLVYLLFWVLWDSLFSPLTISARFEISLQLLLLLANTFERIMREETQEIQNK